MRIDVQPKAFEMGQAVSDDLAAIDEFQGSAPKRLAADEDIGRHLQVFQVVQFLMDKSDSHGNGVGNGADGDAVAVDENRAFVGLMDAADDVHQRAFSRAVFADEGDNLAAANVERNVLQRDDAGEPLADSLQLEDAR